MIGEFNIYGVYLPWLLVLALLAFGASRLLAYLLAQLGFYRLVWHPALFNAALFIIVLGGIASLSSNWIH